MLKIFVFILLSAHLIFVCSVYADTDTVEVVSYPSGCDYFIAVSNKGYCLLKWCEGYCPCVGDFILGDINSTGFKDVYYPLRDREGKIYVEDYSMSESRSIEQYKEHCD